MAVHTPHSATRIAASVAALAIHLSCANPVAPPAAVDGIRGASTLAVGSQSAVAKVLVTITPSTILVGQTVIASATLRDATGIVLTGREVRWQTNSPSVVTVDAGTGVVTGVTAGQAMIRAVSEGVGGYAWVAVNASPAFVVDDFERPVLGPNWQVSGNSVAGIIRGKDLGALSNGPMGAHWVAGDFAANQFSEMTIAVGKDPNMLVQAHVRRQAGTEARYGFHYNPERTPAAWEIKYDGVPTSETRVLASTPVRAPVAGDVIRIEARGREISGYLNGQRILSATDNAPNAILRSGDPGVVARPKRFATLAFPVPLVSRWRGGSL